MCIVFVLAGCSSIEYTSQGTIPVFFSHQKDHVRKRVVEGEVYTFLWGNFPKKHRLYLDKEFKDRGLLSVSNIQIEEFQTTKQRLKEIFSFGMFAVKSFRIRGYGKEARDYEN